VTLRALLQYRATAGFRDRLAAAETDWLSISVVDEDDEPAFIAAMQDADVLWHVLKPVTSQVIANAPRLRLIQKIGVGVNTIDLKAAEERGIAVANMPGTNSRAVAESTLTLMLAALRRTLYFDAITRRGDGWRPEPEIFDGLGEIGARTVGLIGMGAVPSCLTPVLLALGARVLYTSRTPKPDVPAQRASLDELIAQSDIVSLHVPLTDETEKMIDRERIARMKAGVVIVNTARGQLIDEAALVDGLESGHVAAAGLDVFTSEPADATNPLFALPNVVVSPHVAWLTPETCDRSLVFAVENCRRLRSGEALLHRVI
jgi:phosphoglycerate dehydrogenase-like enzyme